MLEKYTHTCYNVRRYIFAIIRNERTTGMIRFEMQSGDTIDIVLYPEEAPKTCENFEKLVREGFFDGIHFHRIVPGFVIQGGDPTGTGTGGSKQNKPGEFRAAGVDNKISHEKGILSMARSGSYTYGFDTASSQFFICLDDSCKALDGYYAAFGKVIDGMDVVDRIASVPTDSGDYPRMVTDEILIHRASII